MLKSEILSEDNEKTFIRPPDLHTIFGAVQ